MIFKKRKRKREVSYEKILKIQSAFNFSTKDLAALIGVSPNQLYHYASSGSAPLDRYIAMVNALRCSVEDEARAKRAILDAACGISDDE